MGDSLTKVLLLAIALGLWVNTLNPWFQPAADWAYGLLGVVQDISNHVSRISNGLCGNYRIC